MECVETGKDRVHGTHALNILQFLHSGFSRLPQIFMILLTSINMELKPPKWFLVLLGVVISTPQGCGGGDGGERGVLTSHWLPSKMQKYGLSLLLLLPSW